MQLVTPERKYRLAEKIELCSRAEADGTFLIKGLAREDLADLMAILRGAPMKQNFD